MMMKLGSIFKFDFFVSHFIRGHFQEIGIAALPLELMPRHASMW